MCRENYTPQYQGTGNREQGHFDGAQCESGNREQETGNGNRKQGTGNREQGHFDGAQCESGNGDTSTGLSASQGTGINSGYADTD